MTPIVRPAAVEDAPQIAAIHVQMWQAAYRGQLPDALLDNLTVEQRLPGWTRRLSSPDDATRTFVVSADGQVMGWCMVGTCRDEDMDAATTGELLAIYMHPAQTSKGYGGLLMRQALDSLREMGYTWATLWVLETNTRTRRWYESKGWRADGVIKTVTMGDTAVREVRYRIELEQK
jgi:L-amino acid N-acyltransferase YncA